jgi:formylglycine-generating enzyme required for sulfatase activity
MILGVAKLNIKKVLYALMVLSVSLALPKYEALANDIQVSNFTTHPFSGGTGEFEFDITWQNSWRVAETPMHWDAAWVFCKISLNGGAWQHLRLDSTGHTIPAGVSTDLGLADTGAAYNASSNPYVGIFLYRSANGTGAFTANDVRLRWNYSDNGAVSGDTVDIRVFAVEMVYIPAGAFSAGDRSSTNAFRQTSVAGSAPWSITSEGAITTQATGPNWYYPGAGDAPGSVFTIPAAFPKGFAAFYMMKGEISQSQWVAFFNALTTTQRSARDITAPGAKGSDGLSGRNSVSCPPTGSACTGTATLPDRGAGATYTGVAMNFISWADVTAYLDWSGLRPMSELEFEKACRGTSAAVSGEYSWGNTTLTNPSSISNIGLAAERANAASNGIAGSGTGPLRVGSFAQGVSTRAGSGSGFYGVMELSGNLWERSVTVGNSSGRSFEGRYHGDGALSASGSADTTSWPSPTTGAGSGFRGGGFNTATARAATSSRGDAAFADPSARVNGNGGRGVRTAP